MVAPTYSSALIVEEEGPVRIITMNRPSRLNAIDAALHHDLARVWRDIGEDRDARVVVLTGAGRAFSAGGDMEWLASAGSDERVRDQMFLDARKIAYDMVQCALPIVAAVNGPALGLGASLALFSDIVIMGEEAVIGDPHVAIGVVAGDGGPVAWPLMTSLLRAKEYLYTGELISAAKAESLGLANKVVPTPDVLPEARSMAARLARTPPKALQGTKRALNMHLTRALEGVLDFALAAEKECFLTEENHALVASFRSHRDERA